MNDILKALSQNSVLLQTKSNKLLQGKFRASILLCSSFVRVISFNFVPNIEMNLQIYYEEPGAHESWAPGRTYFNQHGYSSFGNVFFLFRL